ncbi:hypothetical protein [Novispirillum itersonii]|uniref:hypothetical protein n=1 Tax=Novispirillum itersonii TaxID=189 RepID=UPI00036AFD8C|nr:hypothetical protein [Novispirillum itersonii]
MDHIFLISAMAPLKKHPSKFSLVRRPALPVMPVLLVMLAPVEAHAQEQEQVRMPELPILQTGRVAPLPADAASPQAWLLLEDGTRIRPDLLLPQDLAPLLNSLTGQTISAHGTDGTPDRHRRLPSQITRGASPTDWWQADVVRQGQARVWTDGAATPLQKTLLDLEDDARHRHRGHWQTADWQPVCARHPERLRSGTFVILHGDIRQATVRQGTLWLDFGEDWRTDTSVTLPAAVLKEGGKSWRQPAFWTGKTIEARGWVQGRAGSGSGPRLDLSGSGQIRFLHQDTGACRHDPQANRETGREASRKASRKD